MHPNPLLLLLCYGYLIFFVLAKIAKFCLIIKYIRTKTFWVRSFVKDTFKEGNRFSNTLLYAGFIVVWQIVNWWLLLVCVLYTGYSTTALVILTTIWALNFAFDCLTFVYPRLIWG
jgi:hypothetical protein